MTFWIVVHVHANGVDTIPYFQEAKPTEEEIKKSLGPQYQPKKGDRIEIQGPHQTP